MSTIALKDLHHCFQGTIPSTLLTCSADGIPNIAYISQVFFVDDRHVALSCQFFNKSRQNLAENRRAMVRLVEPTTMATIQLHLRFSHSDTSGPLFEAMGMRLAAIASHTGMAGTFRLESADVFEVLAAERFDGEIALGPPAPAQPLPERTHVFSDLRTLSLVTERMNRAGDLESLLDEILRAMDECFGFGHSMILLPDESRERFHIVASRGYAEGGIGAEVRLGEGLIGTVAQARKALRLSGTARALIYARALSQSVQGTEVAPQLQEVPLPGLADAKSHLAIPLLVQDSLVGILALDSLHPLEFREEDELFLSVLGSHLALAIQNILLRHGADEAVEAEPAPVAAAPPPVAAGPVRTFTMYPRNECVLVDGEYLIRNLPARLLWKILSEFTGKGRTAFTNREFRLDSSLELPTYKDNLESRLMLLRKRLQQKCPDVRMVPTGRGRFALELACDVRLEEVPQ